MQTIIEPFRIKMTEPIALSSRADREKALKAAHYNIFLLNAPDITIDLLTDSGTGAMSAKQWAAMMIGDETYAGSTSWKHFESTVQDITGLTHVFPTHQGRAAERILATCLLKPGHYVPSNSHFDTTRANIEYTGAYAEDLIIDIGRDPETEHPFKGNIDIAKLEAFIAQHGAANIPFCMITVTNNTAGGQPVSLANIRAVKQVLKPHNIPLIMDAARFAENAYFIEQREEGQKGRPLIDIARDMFREADAATMSAKKDGLANIGGFLACNNEEWADKFRNLLILTEGFPTYGGLAGRDLEAVAVGLKEALEPSYQEYRHATVRYMADRLIAKGIPIVRPPGGHALFLDAKRFVPHVEPLQYPGTGLVNALYLEAGIRSCDLGSAMFARFIDGKEVASPMELVRLAFPRRVYTQSHFDYVIEAILSVWEARAKIPGHTITKQAPFLRHFSAHFKPLA